MRAVAGGKIFSPFCHTGSRGAAELAQQQLDDKAMLHEYLLVEFVLTLLQVSSF